MYQSRRRGQSFANGETSLDEFGRLAFGPWIVVRRELAGVFGATKASHTTIRKKSILVLDNRRASIVYLIQGEVCLRVTEQDRVVIKK